MRLPMGMRPSRTPRHFHQHRIVVSASVISERVQPREELMTAQQGVVADGSRLHFGPLRLRSVECATFQYGPASAPAAKRYVGRKLMIEKPDRTTKNIRFGCGAIFGALCGLSFVIYSTEPTTRNTITTCIAFMVIFGLLALRYGDRFWEKISGFPWW